jgi:hypothetical protein
MNPLATAHSGAKCRPTCTKRWAFTVVPRRGGDDYFRERLANLSQQEVFKDEFALTTDKRLTANTAGHVLKDGLRASFDFDGKWPGLSQGPNLQAPAPGVPPAVLAAGGAPGEHGFAVFKFRFRGGAHLGATSPRRHHIWFQLSNVFIECRRATRIFREAVPGGSLAICLAPASFYLRPTTRVRRPFWTRPAASWPMELRNFS